MKFSFPVAVRFSKTRVLRLPSTHCVSKAVLVLLRRLSPLYLLDPDNNVYVVLSVPTNGRIRLPSSGADPGEVKWVNLYFFSYPSNIEIIFDFSHIITKIHPPF